MGKVVFIAEKLLAGVKKTNITLEGMPHNIISFFNTFQKGWGQTHVKKRYKFIKAFWQKIALKLTQKHIKSEKSDILILKCTEA